MPSILTILLSLFVFLIPWQARWVLRAGGLNGGFWEYGTISVYATDILFLMIVLFVIGHLLRHPRESGDPASARRLWILAYAGMTSWVFLSASWAEDAGLALFGAIKLLEGIMFFWIIRTVPVNRTALSTAFIASAAVQSVLGIVQFATQSVFAWPWSGIAPKEAVDLGVAVVEVGDERWLRAYGGFPHPNLLGSFIALALLVLFLQVPRFLKGRQKGVMVDFLFLLSLAALLATGLLLSFSRASWLAFVVGASVWFFTSRAWEEKRLRVFVAAFFAFCVLLFAFFWPLVATRLSGAGRIEGIALSERTSQYSEAQALVAARPVFGFGMSHATRAVHDVLRPTNPSWSYQPIHNVFVLVLVELGVVGLLFFVCAIVTAVRNVPLAHYAFLVPVFVVSFLDHSLWTLHSGILILWCMLGIATLTRGDLFHTVRARSSTKENCTS